MTCYIRCIFDKNVKKKVLIQCQIQSSRYVYKVKVVLCSNTLADSMALSRQHSEIGTPKYVADQPRAQLYLKCVYINIKSWFTLNTSRAPLFINT